MKQNVNDVLKFRQGREEGKLEGIEQGLEQGREEGRFEEKLEMAKNLLNTTSLTLEQVSEITKLTAREIEEIRSENQ